MGKQKLTITMDTDVLAMLQDYADRTRQSKSRALAMLVIAANAEWNGGVADGKTDRQEPAKPRI